MKLWIKLTDQGRVGASSPIGPMGEETDALYVDVPAEFVPEAQRDWKVVDGALVYDPLPSEALLALPTLEEINAARIDYLAMMTGVEL